MHEREIKPTCEVFFPRGCEEYSAGSLRPGPVDTYVCAPSWDKRRTRWLPMNKPPEAAVLCSGGGAGGHDHWVKATPMKYLQLPQNVSPFCIMNSVSHSTLCTLLGLHIIQPLFLPHDPEPLELLFPLPGIPSLCSLLYCLFPQPHLTTAPLQRPTAFLCSPPSHLHLKASSLQSHTRSIWNTFSTYWCLSYCLWFSQCSIRTWGFLFLSDSTPYTPPSSKSISCYTDILSYIYCLLWFALALSVFWC